MKKILGLDLGTNSIGWALVEIDHETKLVKIIGIGARIIPMDGQELSNFEKGTKIKSAAANRTEKHRARITKERYLLRRDRLHLVLNLLEALPLHYKVEIVFENNGEKSGKFKEGCEPKIAYTKNKNIDRKREFYFESAFQEMIVDLQKINPNIRNEKKFRVPKDWTIYYLRNKALSSEITLEELAWILLSYNQKRGYEQMEIEDENQKSDEINETLDLKVIKIERQSDQNGSFDEITLNDSGNFKYKEYTSIPLTQLDDIKEVVRISKLNDSGNVIDSETLYQISDLYSLTLNAIIHRETDDKGFPHRYDFEFYNSWIIEKKSKKLNKSYLKISKNLRENGKVISELYLVKNTYNAKGNPNSIVPSISLPDFSNEGSKDWTLLKKKTEKDTIKFNIDNGYVNRDGSAKYFLSPKIYEVLKNDAITGERSKIVGGLFQTIDRKFYREELKQIIETQKKFHRDKLDSKEIFEKCVKLLYPHNEDHAKTLLGNKAAITNLLIEDILLYQRPLKSKKSEINDCKYEIDYWKQSIDEKTGEIAEIPIYKKAVSSSHPIYQEYRIWDKIHSLKLINSERLINGVVQTNLDVTSDYFKSDHDFQELFKLFNKSKSLKQSQFINFCAKRFNLTNKDSFIWNFPEEEELKGNETRKSFEIRLQRCGFVNFYNFFTQSKEIDLWHYLYSVNFKERTAIGKDGNSSIHNFFTKFFNSEEISKDVFDKIVNEFSNYPKFDSHYGAYSVKALNKLLCFMRVGENFLSKKGDDGNKWQTSIKERANVILRKLKSIDFNEQTINFQDAIYTNVDLRKGELPFPKGLFNTFKDFTNIDEFKFLNLTQASYFIYGRHSELAFAKYWTSPQKIREEISKELEHHSLKNPVAEKVLKEMMQIVADIWEQFGKSQENYFSEIHIEVGRDLQKSNEEKQEIAKNQTSNRFENERLRSLLEEFLCNDVYKAKKGNQDHFDRLKIVDEATRTVSNFNKEFYKGNESNFKEQINKILKKQKITQNEFEKYKLWIEQGYRSPYTGKHIKLSDLFDGNKYNIDHVFPRAIVTNDSLNNKVVCETYINQFKSDKTGRSLISNFGGKEHTLLNGNGEAITFILLCDSAYVELVKTQFVGNKRYILLSIEVPEGFTNSQLNTARHISRKAMELLSHIVREEGEVEYRSKNVLPVTGMITNILKQEWRFSYVWNDLLNKRFERLNTLNVTNEFGGIRESKSGHLYFEVNTKYVLENNKNFEIKRLDHRHHALDALIVALCTDNHVQYISNVNSGINTKKLDNIAAIKKQRSGIKKQVMYSQKDKEKTNETVWKYMLPGSFRLIDASDSAESSVSKCNFSNIRKEPTLDYKDIVLDSLRHCIVTFKNDFKLVTKSSNKHESYYDENGELGMINGKPVKQILGQKNNNNAHWSIRKPLHKDNPSGKIVLQFDKLEIIKNLNKRHLILNEMIKDSVKEVVGMQNGIIGMAQEYLRENPIIIGGVKFEFADFKVESVKFRKRQPITDLAKRSGVGKIETTDQMIDRIDKVADMRLRDDLLLHLKNNENDIDRAFSIDGIAEFNHSRKIPVKNLPIAESGTGKFPVGKKGDNSHKWVEAEQYTNLYFQITRKEDKSEYKTIALREAVIVEKGKLLNKTIQDELKEGVIILSPGDLVFVPNIEILEENEIDFNNLSEDQIKRIFVVNDFSGGTIYFTPNSHAKNIVQKEVDLTYDVKKQKTIGSFDNKTATFNGKQIKDTCLKLNVDRLGNISL